MNINGAVSFNQPFTEFSPMPFPRGYSVPIIAPFWADVDTRCGDGNVFYRQTTSNSIRDKAASDIGNLPSLSSAFYPSLVLIVTWDEVGYYSCGKKVNKDLYGMTCSLLNIPIILFNTYSKHLSKAHTLYLCNMHVFCHNMYVL